MKKSVLLLTIFIFSITQSAFAIDFEDAIFPELATSGRALAMGNAYVSKADDASSVFYNPAGLGTIRNTHFHLSNFHFEVNKGLLSSGTGGAISNASKNVTKMFSLDGTRQVLKNNVGKIAHSRFHMLPNFTSRYFSFGYLLAKRTRAVVTDPLLSTGFEYADRFDHGPYAALNISLFGGIFKAGISTIFLNRKELIGKADPAATLSVGSNSYQKGNAFISTAGGKITLPIVFLPTFSATLHNALKQDFKNGGSVGVPAAIKQSIDVGFSVTPQIGNSSRIHFEVDYKDLSNQFSDVAASRKLLLGMELDLSRIFFIRAGYGDGFGSFGLGVKSQKIEFDITTYAVDTTSASFRGHEDRRFALSLSSGF
ncbi:MAG: hypothetical protein H7336_00055 [Bacteriovorax sp.]|nr:hypothetical protein [Bacteriovorax sp.]